MGKIKRSLGIGAVVILVVSGGIIALAETGNVKHTANPIHALTKISANLHVNSVPISAPAAVLIDANTGQILYAKNILQKHYPASLVKLMTSLIALDMVKKGTLSMHSIIPVSQAAYQVALTPGLSVAYLNPAEKITLSKMLEYMYVVSADDAAVALADAISGNELNFSKLMNQKAKQLGLTGTHYVNASGLQNKNQYTNAMDVAKISQYLILHDPVILKYAAEKGMYIHPGQYGYSYDQLLGQYPGLDGLKTGSTDQAGYCFSGTAVRNGHRLISVVLDSSSFNTAFQDTANLLDFGFNNFKQLRYQKGGQALSTALYVKDAQKDTIAIAPKNDVWLNYQNTANGRKNLISTQVISSIISAPVVVGEQVGIEEIGINGHMVMKVPVFAKESDPKASFLTKAWRSVMSSAHHGAAKILHWVTLKLSKL